MMTWLVRVWSVLVLFLNVLIRAYAEPTDIVLHSRKQLQTPPGCKKLLWFTAVGGPSAHYRKYLRVAMMSAKQNAPSLVPNLIYSSQREDPFVKWWQGKGGVVHHHNLSFYDKLVHAVKVGQHDEPWLTQFGAFLRLDLPILMDKMKITDPDVETKYVLYTDSDVMFWKDINTCSFAPPDIMSMGPEWTKGLKVNSGVLYINHAALKKDRDALIEWGEKRGFPGLFDQTMLSGYYGDRLSLLPDRFNWKPYWGWSSDIALVHLHGPKPEKCLDCLVLHSKDRKPLTGCKCPGIYMWLWEQTPDKGAFYADVLLKFYKYLLHSYGI